MDGGVVDKEAMLVFAMLAQRFAMVAQEQNQTLLVELVPLEPSDQTAEFMIGIGDLSVIQMPSILAPIRFRRIVGAVRIVQMEPEEERSPRILLQPRQGVIHAFSRTAIHQPQVAVHEGPGREYVVVEIKAASQSPTSVQDEGAHHRARVIAMLL